MTPNELAILKKYAKPGSEEALVDIVELMLEQARLPQPSPAYQPSGFWPEWYHYPPQQSGRLEFHPTSQQCAHGRPIGYMCPHCMGLTVGDGSTSGIVVESVSEQNGAITLSSVTVTNPEEVAKVIDDGEVDASLTKFMARSRGKSVRALLV